MVGSGPGFGIFFYLFASHVCEAAAVEKPAQPGGRVLAKLPGPHVGPIPTSHELAIGGSYWYMCFVTLLGRSFAQFVSRIVPLVRVRETRALRNASSFLETQPLQCLWWDVTKHSFFERFIRKVTEAINNRWVVQAMVRQARTPRR